MNNVLYPLAFTLAAWAAVIHWPTNSTLTFVAIGASIGCLIALVRRFPLFGWFLSGFVFGLLGGRGRRW